MNTKRLSLIALLLFWGVNINAQTFITLQGRVLDGQTRKGIPYTAVAVQGTCVGTQANDQGEYKLKVEGDNKSIVFSAIGYKKQTVSVEQLQKNGNVRLEPHALELHEVQITGYVTPQEIIAEAVRRIPQNYHVDTTIGTWFQRDYRMLNGELYLFDESVIDMLRYGYVHDTTKRYYHFTDEQREMDDNYKVVRKHRLLVYDSLSVRLAAGDMEKAMAPMDYSDNNVISDAISTPHANWLTAARLIKKHKYDPIQEYTDADGVEYWLLRAYGRTNAKNIMAYYTLRIRKDNFAIIDAGFDLDTVTASVDYPNMLQTMSPWSKGVIHCTSTNEHYELRGDRYTLTRYSYLYDATYYCHQHYGYELAAPEQHRVESREWILTDLQPGDTSFLRLNPVQGHKKKDLIDAFGTSSYDEDFWEHYNTLPLDANVQAALDRFFSSSSTSGNTGFTSDTSKTLIADVETKRVELDTLRAIKDTLAPTLPPLPRWQFYRYGGIGGNRLVGDDTATHRCFSQQLALGARLNLGGRFSLSADLQYAWMTSPTDDHGRVSTHNLTLPLRLNFDLLKATPEADMRIYLTVGGWGRFAFLGRLGDDWNVLGNSIDRWDYGFSIGIGMELFRTFFMEWNSYRSLHNSILDNSAPELYRHNGAFTIGILF
jgi:hypothetical protein